MGKRLKRFLCVMLAFGLLLANILHENTPVQAAGDSSGQLYKWHQAKTIDDLKHYVNEADNTEITYEKKWVPIVIVATYADGTSYYWNRNTKISTLHSGESELVPRNMKPVNNSDEIGMILANALKSGRDFTTKGDLGAMHMFYHGKQKSTYEDGYVEAETWSLTKDDVTDFSDEAPSTVYGIRNHNTYVSMDQNNVETWQSDGSLPVTSCPRDKNKSNKFRQAWTFYEDRFEGSFLIANMYAWATRFKLSDGAFGIYAPTIGCALSGSSRLASADKSRRDSLEAPSGAAAVIYNKKKPGKTLSGEDARRAIIDEYDDKYDSKNTRVQFKIFVGQKIAGGKAIQSRTVKKSSPYIVGAHSTVPENATITVEQGATLIVPEYSTMYLDGTIVNEGTIIVEKGATVTSSSMTENLMQGQIVCRNGGNLLVMEDARVLLPYKLDLQDSSMVCKGGIVIVSNYFRIHNSQVQLTDHGRFVVGVKMAQGAKMFPQLNLGTHFDNFNSMLTAKPQTHPTKEFVVLGSMATLDVDDNSSIVVEPTGVYEISSYLIALQSGRMIVRTDRIVVGMQWDGYPQGRTVITKGVKEEGDYSDIVTAYEMYE